MSSWSERVVGELHATLGELSSDVSKGRGEACGVWPNTEPPHPATHQAPLVWRAPEGPEGTGGLRGAALNEVRPPSLADSRALRRPEHPWGHKQRRPIGGRREACGAWPGFETTRRAKLAARTASGRAGLAAAGNLTATQSDKKVVAPRKTWGPPLMRSLT